MLKIGDFSKLSRVSIRMLRHYDEIGLLMPAGTDPFTGYRYYTEAQLPAACRINALKDMGFGLAAVAEILGSYGDPDGLSRYLNLKRMELREEAEETARRLKLLETMLERLRKDGTTMQYDVTLKVLPERQVASVRGVIPAYDQEQRLWNTLMQETAGMRLVPGDPCYTLAVFHDGEFKEGEVDVEVQKSVRGGYRDTEHVKFKAEPPVEIASATYTGGYDRINEANQAVANWVRDNGYDFAGLSFCIYHVSPYDTENPEEYVTEVCYPVRKK